VLERENRELRRANELLRRAAPFFGAELDRQRKRSLASWTPTVGSSGSNPSARPCRWALPPTGRPRAAGRRCGRLRDVVLGPILLELWTANRKLWKAARRAGLEVSRDQVARADGPLASGHPPRGAHQPLRRRQPIHLCPLGEHLSELGALPSIGSVGDPWDNALVETVNALYKIEQIGGPDQGPWRTIEQVELATLGWVHR
jgi:transposase InsO family protein